MKIHAKNFCFPAGKKVRLKQCPTLIKPLYASQKEYKDILQKQVEELSSLQCLHYASGTYALLLIFQGMDTAGKDGVIGHVLSGINPQGCEVHRFNPPSAEELKHDFLWRASKCLPERGKIGVFNRSYYEEVLIVRVHPEHLQREGLQEVAEEKSIWDKRYHAINGFEKHLHENGTRILKFFLHLSKEEQRKRFLQRIDDPDKNWKLSMSDIEERKFWKHYRVAYEECLQATSTSYAPWHIIPADDKANARLIVARIILEKMGALKMSYPKATPEHAQELQAIRAELADEK